MKSSTYIHIDGTISLFVVDAIIQKNDDWRKTPHGINNRYVVISEYDGHLDIEDPTILSTSYIQSGIHTVTLVKLPTGTRGLTIMHAPICLELWYHQTYNSDALQRKYYGSITDALKDAAELLNSFDEQFSIRVTSAGGNYILFNQPCGTNFHNGMIKNLPIKLYGYPDNEESP